MLHRPVELANTTQTVEARDRLGKDHKHSPVVVEVDVFVGCLNGFVPDLQGLGNGVICCSFREHIQHNLQHRSKQLSLNYPFLDFGFYYEQLRRYLDRFGASVWVGFHEDFQDRPSEVYQSICRFLGVAEGFSPSMERRHLEAQVPRVSLVGWLKRSGLWKATAMITPLSLRPLIRHAVVRKPGTARIGPADRRYLIDFYRKDIRKLESLLGRNLDEWLKTN